VNLVNARAFAEERGVGVVERRTDAAVDYTNLLTVTALPGQPVSGTTIGAGDRPWLVAVHGRQLEIELDPALLVLVNEDRPGMIGAVGSLLGSHGVNIANMSVSRSARGEEAVMVLSLDGGPPPATLAELRALAGIKDVRFVSLDGPAAP
jgi:D-3-phosphoglycerate dehydrogenase